MKMADLLRQLADKLDGLNDIDDLLNTAPSDPQVQPVMITPLQQKLELLKKGVGVESEFDTDSESKDEIATIRKNAGLAGVNQAIIQIASDDTEADI
jgi:hypothetical protein